MKKFNYQQGQAGEEIAQDFLIQKGYQIVQSNWRTRWGEIDLIVQKNEQLIFVEVKLKKGEMFGSPEEMINLSKLEQIKKTAQSFLQANPQLIKECPQQQIDAVCIVLNPDDSIKRITHWQNLEK